MLAIFSMGMQELVIIGVIAVLLFGKRLPEVAKSLGASYRDFRKGLSDLQSHVDIRDTFSSTSTPSSSSSSSTSYTGSTYGDFDDTEEATAPKFEPPPSPPQQEEDKPPSDEVRKPISEK